MKLAPDGSRVQGRSVLQCAYQETLDGRLIAVSASAVAGAVIVYAVLGPMGMEDNLGPLQRLAFVGTVCALCWPLCHAFSATVLYLARARPPIQILAFAVAGVLFMAIPCSAVAYAFYGLFDPDGAARDEILETYLNVAVLLAICSSLVHYAACQRVKLKRARATNLDTPRATAKQTPTAAQGAEGFFSRLPATVGRDVVYLGVSGHYLTVVTTAGSCLILMRLTDAVAALGDLGIQVHRSYWVAHHHIQGVIKRDDRTLVRITGAQELPVSRTYLANVRAAVPNPSETPPPGRDPSGND